MKESCAWTNRNIKKIPLNQSSTCLYSCFTTTCAPGLTLISYSSQVSMTQNQCNDQRYKITTTAQQWKSTWFLGWVWDCKLYPKYILTLLIHWFMIFAISQTCPCLECWLWLPKTDMLCVPSDLWLFITAFGYKPCLKRISEIINLDLNWHWQQCLAPTMNWIWTLHKLGENITDSKIQSSILIDCMIL